jgi:hypothetical protein
MRLLQLQNQYLYEGLDRESRNTVMLWESAGIKLREAQLTADQIQQLFAEIEKGATAGGSNRTMLGKGKDAAVAVNKAWEDLKTKIQDSKPIKNVDAAFDRAVAKIEAGLGGPDNKVNQVIQKYRKFAKERPISQSLIYAALIAAAGISGAGLGGAAVLGLLKMTDKLLQGEKFSSAAYAGGKTGALAYGAGQIGQAMRGGDAAGAGAPKDGETFGLTGKADNAALAKDMSDNPMLAQRAGVSNVSAGSDLSNQILDQSLENPAGRFAARQAVADALKSGDVDSSQAKELIKQIGSAATNPEAAEQAITQTLQNTGSSAASNAASSAALKAADVATSADPFTVAGQTMKASLKDTIMKMSDEDGEKAYHAWRVLVDGGADIQTKMGAGQMLQQLTKKYESAVPQGKKLSEGQVYLVFNRVCLTNDRLLAEGVLKEGPMDFFKGAAAKGMDKLKTVGKNLTTKVTADKLNSAWKKAGSPMDSEEVAAILKQAGVGDDIVGKVYTDLKLPTPGAAPAADAEEKPVAAQAAAGGYAEIKKTIMQLNTKDRKRMIAYLTKQLGTA